jgi:PAS domain S-box-containing protein
VSLLRPTSLRQRLLLIAAALTLLTLAVASTLFVFHDVRMLRGQMVRDLEVLAVAVGDNCLSALVFDAPESAERNLASLQREYQVRYAILYDADGERFAHYQRDRAQRLRDPTLPGEGVVLDPSPLGLGTVDVVRDLSFDGRPIGRIYIHAGMDELAAQLRRYAAVVAVVFLLTLGVSLLSALRLQRRVTEPILALAARTREISEGGSYALRVSPPGPDDEIAVLYRGFNTMLEQIERHERELAQIRAHLEHLVHDRTRALNALVREQRRILESLPLGVIHLVGRRIVRVNPRAAVLFGWAEEEMPGLDTERFYPEPEAFEELGAMAYPLMAAGGVYREDRILQRKDGSRFWGRLIGQYVDPSSVDLGSIWIIDNVDRDRALAEQMRQAREAAEAASRAKGAFLASMSHELRTPLNSVMGFAQLLDGDPRLPGDQRQHVRAILRSGHRLLGLINDVLDLAKIEADRYELVAEEWSTDELLQELTGMFRARAARKGLDFRIEPSPALPGRLHCDVRCLHQVLTNLLDNAIKYTDAGTVTLRAGFAGERLTLEVTDTGAGIPADRREEVFEPFRQVGDPAQRGLGTGLGLAITRGLVLRMGGTIDLESAPGEGSTFRVRVPARAVEGRPEPTSGPPPPAAVILGYRRTGGEGPLRILIADDEQENREVLRRLLEPLGFAVEEASTGRDCVDTAGTWTPDLILMDLRMPDLDGLEATRTLRERAASATTPIVAVSAATFEEDRTRARAAGCNAHLAKPVLFPVLTEAVRALLPIEWVYGDAPADQEATPGCEELPARYAERLVELVRTGSISALKALAGELESEGGCPALAKRVATLADELDLDGLRRLAGRPSLPDA